MISHLRCSNLFPDRRPEVRFAHHWLPYQRRIRGFIRQITDQESVEQCPLIVVH
jgi:hypothetical protein